MHTHKFQFSLLLIFWTFSLYAFHLNCESCAYIVLLLLWNFVSDSPSYAACSPHVLLFYDSVIQDEYVFMLLTLKYTIERATQVLLLLLLRHYRSLFFVRLYTHVKYVLITNKIFMLS